MPKCQSTQLTNTYQPDITENHSTHHADNNDSNVQSIQDVQEAIEKEQEKIKRLSLPHDTDSDIEIAPIRQQPLMTTDKPWYSIELINIYKKEHIIDAKDYSILKKSSILAVVAISAAMSPFSTSIYYPAMVNIQVELDTTDTAINASISVFVFVTAFFPLLWAELSERLGSRPVYLISFFIFFVGNICCAISVNISMFIAFRTISAIGSSSIMAMGGGTIADVFESHQRGRALAYYTSGVLLGPALSPIVGGYLNQIFGWKSIFWFLSILGFCNWLSILLMLPETKKLSAMEPKKTKMKYEYKNRNEEQIDSSNAVTNCNQEKNLKLKPLLGPLGFFRFPNVILTTATTGNLFFTYYIINVNFSRIYTNQYGLASGIVGVCYISLAGGAIIGSFVGGKLSDVAYKKQTTKIENKEEIQPEVRLMSPAFYGAIILLLFSFIAFGWCVQANVHYAAGLVCIFFRFAFVIPIVIIPAYFMDCFSKRSSAVLACNNMVRYAMAGIGSLIASDIERALGPGILYTICGAIILLASGNIIILRMKGKKWAMKRKEAGF